MTLEEQIAQSPDILFISNDADAAGANNADTPAADLRLESTSAVKRRKPFRSKDIDSQILVIRACKKYFPWGAMHSRKAEAWNSVAEDVNRSLSADDPPLLANTAGTLMNRLLTGYLELTHAPTDDSVVMTMVRMPEAVREELQPLADMFVAHIQRKAHNRFVDLMFQATLKELKQRGYSAYEKARRNGNRLHELALKRKYEATLDSPASINDETEDETEDDDETHKDGNVAFNVASLPLDFSEWLDAVETPAQGVQTASASGDLTLSNNGLVNQLVEQYKQSVELQREAITLQREQLALQQAKLELDKKSLEEARRVNDVQIQAMQRFQTAESTTDDNTKTMVLLAALLLTSRR